MEPTKIYLEDGQPREKVGTARGTATYYKNGDIDFKAYAQGEPQQLPSREAQRELRKAAVRIKRCPMEYEECGHPREQPLFFLVSYFLF